MRLIVLLIKSVTTVSCSILRNLSRLSIVDNWIRFLLNLSVYTSSFLSRPTNASQIEEIYYEVGFDMVVKWWISGERRSKIDFENPRVEIGVKHDVVTKQLEAVVSTSWALCGCFSLSASMQGCLDTYQWFNDGVIYFTPHKSHVDSKLRKMGLKRRQRPFITDIFYNFMRMRKRYGPEEFDYLPETYILPDQITDFKNVFNQNQLRIRRREAKGLNENYSSSFGESDQYGGSSYQDNIWIVKPA